VHDPSQSAREKGAIVAPMAIALLKAPRWSAFSAVSRKAGRAPLLVPGSEWSSVKVMNFQSANIQRRLQK